MKLESLIKKAKFDYVNSNITAANFPAPKTINTDFKLFHFDKYISSEDAIKEMEREGYSPANIYELLSWKEWNDKDVVVALGSVAGFGGGRCVACLGWDDSLRYLDLYNFGGVWIGGWRFLGVRNSSTLKSSSSLSSGTLILKKIGEVKRLVEEIEQALRDKK